MGNISRNVHNQNSWSVKKEINLRNFQIKNIYRQQNSFNRISTVETRYALSLQHTKGGDYGYDGVLNIIKNGKVIHKIIRGSTNGYRHNCYGWYKDFIVSGGTNGFIKIYNRDGKEVASLIGHIGEVWSIAIDGDRLVSGSDDHTIRIWDLSKLKMKNEKLKIDEKFVASIMKQYNISRESVIRQAIKQSDSNLYLNFPRLQPQLNLFISKTNDWVVWTPNGFFDASKNGAKYIGYHINHGADHEAEFLPIDKFDKLHRPDLIQKALNGEDLTSYANKININKLLKIGGRVINLK